MKTTLSIFAICLTAACGGSGGSMSNTSSGTGASIPIGLGGTGGSIPTGLGGTGGSTPTATTAVAASIAAVDVATDRTFGGMLNDVRAVNGSNPLSYNGQLGQAAQGHADDMLALGYFSHTSDDGRSLSQRVAVTGYRPTALGENIARGQRDEEEVLKAWVNSPGHQRNNVNSRYEDFALAKAGTGANQYWVLVLGAE